VIGSEDQFTAARLAGYMHVLQNFKPSTQTALQSYLTALFACLSLLFAPLAIGAEPDAAQESLRSADTSSPRATLNSFLTDSKIYVEDFNQDEISDKSYRAFRRASHTLDFRAGSETDSWYVRSRRVAMLYEVLARIDLPEVNQVPGVDEVAGGDVEQWTIPDTDITIIKIAEGPRKNQFLFSEETVEELKRGYKQVKQLPYKPGFSNGIYEELSQADSPLQTQEQQLNESLKPADTSSPRATLEGFLDNVNQAYILVSEANTALQTSPPTITYAEARELESSAVRLLQQAKDTLDLSQVPAALRKSAEREVTLQLKEIFDRMLLPPLDIIPTRQMIEAARKESFPAAQQTGTPFRWTVPNTQFEIVEIVEGDRQGEFLFSAETVRHIRESYTKIENLPYRRPYFGGIEQEYRSPELSPGFYENYVAASGYLVPRAHFRGRVVETLPGWLKAKRGKQQLWQWIGLLVCMLLAFAAIYSANRYSNLAARHFAPPLYDWLQLLGAAALLIFFLLLDQLVDETLKITANLHAIVTSTFDAAIFLATAWLVFVICRTVAETIAASRQMRDLSSEAALLRIGASVTGFLIAVGIIIDGLQALGADLVPLLAGLGIGGLAVALAAQSTIANFIGGLILLSNKPIRVGDFCRYGEDPSPDWLRIGTIEDINWISTRIRGIDRTLTTIPNAEFANMHIVNLTKRDMRLMRTTLQLRYETTSEQLRYILVKLRELLLQHPKASPEGSRVRMIAYGTYSKDIEIYCYLLCEEQVDFLAIQEDLLLRIEAIITAAGSGFAFPSQTAYLARDKGLDDEHRQEAETEIAQLRGTGKLPFPEFDEEERGRLEDSLDYPPEGSPDYQPRTKPTDPKSGS